MVIGDGRDVDAGAESLAGLEGRIAAGDFIELGFDAVGPILAMDADAMNQKQDFRHLCLPARYMYWKARINCA